MTQIKKHSIVAACIGIFVMLIVLNLMISTSWMTIETSSEIYQVPYDIDERITSLETAVTYELIDLKTDASFKYPFDYVPFFPTNYTSSGGIAVAQTNLNLINESYLSKGTHLTVHFETEEGMSGLYRLLFLNEEGISFSLEATKPEIHDLEFNIEQSGNYAIILYTEEALGSYDLDFTIKKPWLHF